MGTPAQAAPPGNTTVGEYVKQGRRVALAMVAIVASAGLTATLAPPAGAITTPKINPTALPTSLPTSLPTILPTSPPNPGGTVNQVTKKVTGSGSSTTQQTKKQVSSTTSSTSSTSSSSYTSSGSGGSGSSSSTMPGEQHYLKHLKPTSTACCPGNPALSSAVSKLDALIARQDQLGAKISRLKLRIKRLRKNAAKAMHVNKVMLSNWGFVGVSLVQALQSGLPVAVPSQARTVTRFMARLQVRQARLDHFQTKLDDLISANKHKVEKLQKRIKKLRERETTAQQLQQASLSSAVAPLRGYAAHPAPAPTKQVKIAMHAALAQLGKPYVWGADGPSSFDCSGLTMYAWGNAGVALPHNAAAQASVVRPVPYDRLRPGDLLFYEHPIGHVTMYIGNEQMIEAPHTGAFVRVVPVRTTDLVGAGRP